MRSIAITVALLTLLPSLSLQATAGDLSGVEADHRPDVAELSESVSVAEAARLLERGAEVLVLDVRSRGEYSEGHLPRAKLLPITELAARMSELAPYQDKVILVYCRTQNRSMLARSLLAGVGYHVTFMRGGIMAWQEAERPLAR